MKESRELNRVNRTSILVHLDHRLDCGGVRSLLLAFCHSKERRRKLLGDESEGERKVVLDWASLNEGVELLRSA